MTTAGQVIAVDAETAHLVILGAATSGQVADTGACKTIATITLPDTSNLHLFTISPENQCPAG